MADYFAAASGTPTQRVALSQLKGTGHLLLEDAKVKIRSEACLALDLGAGHLPGMLIMGAKDPQQFSSKQGTELLTFFAEVFERTMRRLLL